MKQAEQNNDFLFKMTNLTVSTHSITDSVKSNSPALAKPTLPITNDEDLDIDIDLDKIVRKFCEIKDRRMKFSCQ